MGPDIEAGLWATELESLMLRVGQRVRAHFTVAEVRRLLDALLPRPTPRLGPVARALNWPLWRRRHQAAACRCRRRTSSGNDF